MTCRPKMVTEDLQRAYARGATSCFYHPELNAHHLYATGDGGNTDVTMLAYRYKSAKAQETEKGK